jgi:Kef-type K+ transport system membrane component KefB
MILLNDILIIVGLSVLVFYLCLRIRIPIIVGFLLTGLISGPYGPGLVRDIESVKILAGGASGATDALLLFPAKVVFIIALVSISAKWVVPQAFYRMSAFYLETAWTLPALLMGAVMIIQQRR